MKSLNNRFLRTLGMASLLVEICHVILSEAGSSLNSMVNVVSLDVFRRCGRLHSCSGGCMPPYATVETGT